MPGTEFFFFFSKAANLQIKQEKPITVKVLIAGKFHFRGNQLDTDIALGTVEYLNKEMDYITRYAANRQLDFLDNMLSQSIYYGKFKVKS